MADNLKAPVLSGLAVGSALVLLFAISNTIPTMCGAPGLQISAPDMRQQVQYSDMIVYGTVLSAELQPVYYTDPFGDAGTSMRYVVTIYADRYLLDKTGQGAKIITFKEYGFGCAYPFRSEVNKNNPYAVEHTGGEKAVFFIAKLEDGAYYLGRPEVNLSVFSLFDKFAIVRDDDDPRNNNSKQLIQSKYHAMNGREAITIEKLESEVNMVVREIDSR